MHVKYKQHIHPLFMELKKSILSKLNESFSDWRDCVLRYQGRLCVTDVEDLRKQILEEAHGPYYSIHPGATKIYHDHREVYRWDGLNSDIAMFVAKRPICQQVNA